MKSLWNNQDAEKAVDAYAAKGIARDLALRVYTTRLLGGEPKLVLHGGGNTSCKTTATDLVGDSWDVLCVKGSGWDMGTIEPAGLPAVKLAPLLKARISTPCASPSISRKSTPGTSDLMTPSRLAAIRAWWR